MPRKPSLRQVQKNEKTRQKLMEAAMKVVGRAGYAKASIAKIAEQAGVSTGTFYLHFTSKEQLYDALLPWANTRLSDFVAERTVGARCYMAFEEANIRGFFDYIAAYPSFLPVMIEAEVAAPKAWQEYVAIREKAYIDILSAAWDRGEFPDYSREDMSQICTMLIGLRKALVVRYCDRRNRRAEPPAAALDTYLTFVLGALHRSNAAAIQRIWKPKPSEPAASLSAGKASPRASQKAAAVS